MDEQWYFVEKGERRGPVSKLDILKLVEAGKLGDESYVWIQGFEDWKKIKDVDQLQNVDKTQLKTLPSESTETMISDSTEDKTKLNFRSIGPNEKMIFIKTGLDRGGRAKEYGPFSLPMLTKLYKANRINGKTLVFFPGLDVWRVLASFEDFEEVFEELPPPIEENEKRLWERKPFTARLFFTNQDQFYEGICRDISLGGMKVLINNFPGKEGEEISLNVHPEESNHQFVAKAKIVRILSEDSGFSLEFIDLDSAAKAAISSYLATH